MVVPAYNVEQYVGETLRSLEEQTLEDWECVVVDDGSVDGTAAVVAEVARREPRIRMVRQANHGLSGARNTGLRELTANIQYVAFVDSDDTLCPSALADLVVALERNPDAVGAWGWAEMMGPAGEPLAPGRQPEMQRDRRGLHGRHLRGVRAEEPLTFAEVIVAGPIWPPATALHRRSLVDAVGAFDESLQQLEDWDYYTRACRHGSYVPVLGQVAWYRQHPGQMTKRTVEFVCNLDRVRRKTWAAPENTDVQRRQTIFAWRQLQARRTFRAAQRCAVAVRGRRVGTAGRLAVGTAVLAAQLFLGHPPRTAGWQVRWTQRRV